MSRPTCFAEFWPLYLAAHSRPGTRAVHYAGTIVGIGCAVLAVATGVWMLIPIGLALTYGPLFLAHFLIERNKPATFEHPLWSVGGDLKMLGLWLAGEIREEVERLVPGEGARR